MASAELEFVYVVKRCDLFDLSFPHGFVSAHEDPERIAAWWDRIRTRGFFIERRHAEVDSSFKQVIPYCVVTSPAGEVFLLERLGQGGEARLHGKLSIGVGGHFNPCDDGGGARADADRSRLLEASCARELDEEMLIESRGEPKPIGVINDDSNDVGSVHFGLVYHVPAMSPGVRVRETEMLRGEFVKSAALMETFRESRSRFESWSALILERWPLEAATR